MFETATTTVYARSNRVTVLEAVSFSLILHAAVVAVALAANTWSVSFPDQSPAFVVSFVLADPTPPPPPPPPARPLVKTEPAQQVATVKPDEVLAPTVIPDEIPIVQSQVVAAIAAAPTGVEGGVAWGVEGESAGGVVEGDRGGKPQGVVGSAGDGEVVDHMVHVARDKPLPMFPLSQVYPSYPEDARMNAWEDNLVVRYIIGRDGRVKDVQVVRLPEHDVFIDGTVRAIRSWRFRPLIRDGERQEVVHELTIQYRLTQEG